MPGFAPDAPPICGGGIRKQDAINQQLGAQIEGGIDEGLGSVSGRFDPYITLYLMSGIAPDLLFKLAAVCFGLHGILSWLLRVRLDGDAASLRALFSNPALENQNETGRLLKLKYFWPFVHSPAVLSEHSGLTVVLFWAARLAGLSFAALMVAFFVSLFAAAGA